MKSWFVLALIVLTAVLAMARDIPGEKIIIKPSQPTIIEPGFFGIHFHRLRVMPNEKAVTTVWPPFKFGMLRLLDSRTRWADIEPSKADWRFDRLDYYINEASTRGVQVMYTLGSTPRWASARPDEPCSYGFGCAAEPRSFEDWREYVRVVAKRYRGKVCCYEVWNEPDFAGPPKVPTHGGFFTGSVANMVEMARIAHEVLLVEDPTAILFSPAFTNGPYHRLDKFLAAGGRDQIQGVAYHFYAASDENLVKQIETVRQVVAKNGLKNLPLWSTEAGVEVYAPDEPLPPGVKNRLTREAAAAVMTRQIVLAAFSGLEKYFYYAWDSDKSGMVDRNGQPRPSRDAMLLVQRWLIGSKPDHCVMQVGKPTICWGEKDSKPFAIVWNPAGDEEVAVPVPNDLRIVSRQVAVPRWLGLSPGATALTTMLANGNPAFYSFERVGSP